MVTYTPSSVLQLCGRPAAHTHISGKDHINNGIHHVFWKLPLSWTLEPRVGYLVFGPPNAVSINCGFLFVGNLKTRALFGVRITAPDFHHLESMIQSLSVYAYIYIMPIYIYIYIDIHT